MNCSSETSKTGFAGFNYKGKRYFTTKEEIKDTLEKYGVAIIPNLLSEKECKQMKKGMWNYLEHITSEFETPISRRDNTTWKEFGKLYPLHSMLLQRWGIGHSQMVWDLRQNTNIIDVFCSIYSVEPEELLVSFDGASFHFPPEVTGVGWRRVANSGWLHTDQSYTRHDFECVQSWVSAEDVEPGDATLVFLQGSHKYHKEFQKKFGIKSKADWTKLTPEQIKFYEDKGCELVYIRCPKGSLVCWDSRTIHAGTEPVKQRENPKIRCVAYLCYMPRGEIKPAMLKKKQKAFKELRTTSHWPCKPKLFSKFPRTWGKPLPPIVEIEPPVVGELGMKMAGFSSFVQNQE